MKEFIEKLIGRLEETDFNDIQMVVREVLLKYGFPYESVVQDEVWNALDELSTNKFAIKIVNQLAEEHNNGWIPVEERLPDTNNYILLSFSNFTIPAVGRYEVEEDGSGAFYICDELETCVSQELFVNAWQQLPGPYKECE